MSCIFCDISQHNQKAHVIWEDKDHISFLSIFPNTVGVTVVIPKKHYSSYAFDQPEEVLFGLIGATKKTALLLDKALPGVARTGMVFEGYGVDHLHAKLFPMHCTGNTSEFKKINSNNKYFFEKYEGYLSSHDGSREKEETLEKQANLIRLYNTEL
ncbi:HIT family protein [Pseudomonas sp. NFX98]|uniref:HIT family protein n=1 Tax=Pseudomonas sp. NFX98 TaxID=3399122 RepID=UPI0039FC2EA2